MLTINARQKILHYDGGQRFSLPCLIGEQGYIDQNLGREGDFKTPLGAYILRFGLYRKDRLAAPKLAKCALPFWPIQPSDGWCDDPKDPAYNRFIRLPYCASHEAMSREDGAYDIVLIMSHNDSPPKEGLGSAVFIHIARIDMRPTAGCIALTPDHMAQLLPVLRPQMIVKITDE